MICSILVSVDKTERIFREHEPKVCIAAKKPALIKQHFKAG